MILVVALAYLLGAIPFSLIAGRLTRGIDLRGHGSGNLGAANAFRTLGPVAGVAVLLLDAGKGAAAVAVAALLWRDSAGLGRTDLELLAGLAAVAGHIWTVFGRFKGGKGVATAAGVFAAIAPTAFAACVGIWVVVVGLLKYISLGSILAAACLPAAVHLTYTGGTGDRWRVFWVSVVVAVAVVARHRSNISRLLHGNERKFSLRGG
ncbi:MAG: glycerol-3-phosphate 1-O-acyltransferase PlsY [Candidatus Eisenbacteria bacterium]|nr:glycerol-3-phosphate 1-O-acyltransferase PlsY [Candidatus Eisenbacteria bacterium]